MTRRRSFLLWMVGVVLVVALALAFFVGPRLRRAMTPSSAGPGCAGYLPAPGILVAHAGGGTPWYLYPNSLVAMEASYQRGHRLFELDLMTVPGIGLRLGHKWADVIGRHSVDVAAVLSWLKDHPDGYLITDIKTDNVEGLTLLSREAGPLRARIIPQIYQPSELRSVIPLGFHPAIFTLYRNTDQNWLAFANRAPLFAVTMPVAMSAWASEVRRPVFLHTINTPGLPRGVSGVYTDCLVPLNHGRQIKAWLKALRYGGHPVR